MDVLREYVIPFVGLKTGIHKFEYEITDSFFSNFEKSVIQKCHIDVDLTFEKNETFFILNFNFAGTAEVECDRCLELMEQDIFGDYTVYVKFDDEQTGNEDDEDVIYIDRNEQQIDISRLLYDYINISMPIQRIHPNDENGNPTCNPEVLKYLKKDTKNSDEIDPRWDKLNKLQNPK